MLHKGLWGSSENVEGMLVGRNWDEVEVRVVRVW